MQQVSTESSSWRTCYEKYIKEQLPRHKVSYHSFHRTKICHPNCGKCYKPASISNNDTLYLGIYSANSKGFLLLHFAFDKLLQHSFEHEPNTPFSEDMASISKVGCTHHFIIINFANGPYHGIHKDKGRPIHAIQTWSIAWIQRCKQGW